MFRLQLLGFPELVAKDGTQVPSVLAQPKRLALLTYLAANPGGQCSRDGLIGVFWPDRSEHDARNSLRQALHFLRTSLGDGAVVNLGDHRLGIDPNVVECDVVRFEECVEAGDLKEALQLYRGRLVEGLHVSGCPEFDHWCDQRSETLRRLAVAAAITLANRAEADGDLSGVAEYTRRAVELEPFDESHVQGLMRSLAAGGDRASAVVAFEAFEARMADELELEPSAETIDLLREIRVAPDGVPDGVFAAPPTSEAIGPVPAAVAHSPLQRERIGRRRRLVAGALLLAVAGTVVMMTLDDGAAAPESDLPRMVVLPFENLGDPADDYFAEGITEEITSTLSGLRGLRVIARQTAIQYAGSTLSAQEIAVELRVDYVLEGTVRMDRGPDGSKQVRITPQLIRGSDEVHLWAEPYTADLVAGEIFRVQAEIARRIAEEMNVVLPAPEEVFLGQGGTEHAGAYDFYLRGRSYSRRGQRRLANQQMAADMFERAVAADPNFIEAQASLANTYLYMASRFGFNQPDLLSKAVAMVEKAVALEPDHPAVQVAQGEYHRLVTRRLDLAEQHYLKAIQLRPRDASLLPRLGDVQRNQGKYAEARATLERALELDPRSSSIMSSLANVWMQAGQYAEAEALYDRAIALQPDGPFYYFFKTILYLRWDGSRERAQEVLTSAVGRADLLSFLLVSWDFDDALILRTFATHFAEGIRRRTLADPADSVAYYLAKGHTVGRDRGAAQENAYYDSARVVLEGRVESSVDPERTTRNLALTYAYLDRPEDARRTAAELPSDAQVLAHIYVLLGDYEEAIDHLEAWSSTDSFLSVPMLRVDPVWNPLREHPRFQRLLGGGG